MKKKTNLITISEVEDGFLAISKLEVRGNMELALFLEELAKKIRDKKLPILFICKFESKIIK